MTSEIKYGLIGAGLMGQEHIRNIAITPDARIVAVADPHGPSIDAARRMLRRDAEHIAFVPDYRALLGRRDIDAWIIATPNFTHGEILRDVLASPGAVMVEKPLCTTLEDCRAIERAAASRAAPVWVALEYRHMPPVAEFLARLSAGAVGSLKMLSIREHRFPFLPKVGDWNRFNRNTGGTLVEKCCHFFDLMRAIIGREPLRVMASGAQDVNHTDERYGGEAPDILDNAFVIVDFEGGVRASLDLCMFAEGSKEQEEIVAVGDRGKLEVFIPSGEIVTSPRGPKAWRREHIPVPDEILRAGSHHGASFYHHRAFQRMLRDGTPPVTGVRDGLMSVAMGIAAHRSIEESRVVSMAELAL